MGLDTTGGGSAGFSTLANEYISVACSILEATVDYPFRFGATLGERARHWGMELRRRFNLRVSRFYPDRELTETSKLRIPPHCYIFARTVPCPETGHHTPLVPDWHVLKPTSHSECGRNCLLAVPHVDKAKGKWSVEFVRGDNCVAGHPGPLTTTERAYRCSAIFRFPPVHQGEGASWRNAERDLCGRA